MKQIYLTLVFGLLISVSVFGQLQERPGEERVDTIITLDNGLKDSVTVILIENDQYLVTTSLSIYHADIIDWITLHAHIKSDKKLLDLVLEDSKNNSIVNGPKLAMNANMTSRLEYRIASLMEKGQCTIFDKTTHQMISEIKIQYYSYECGGLCGDEGRRFFVNESLLLQVMDWIS